jgi:hypothetical protein
MWKHAAVVAVVLLVVRVLGRDGECFDRTSDLRTDRVDLYIEDGEVVQARQPQAGTT